MNDDPDSRCSLHLEVAVRDPAWRQTIPDVEALTAQAAEAALSSGRHKKLVCASPVEAAVTLADDALSRELNDRYRGQDKPTNVLSFSGVDAGAWPCAVAPEDDAPPLVLGDVVIARQTTVREAQEQGKPLRDHLCHLVVHGMLHLLGYDHLQEPAAVEMERLEAEILATLGVADPYLSDAVAGEAPRTWRGGS